MLVLTCALVATPVSAAELKVTTAVSGRIEYNDNVTLSFNPQPSWRSLVQPSVVASRTTESSQLSARLALGFNRYSNQNVGNSTDKLMTLSANQVFERSNAGLVVGYSEISSQSIQVLGQTGINVGRVQVETLNVTPTWTYKLSPLVSLNASAGYTATKFQQANSVNVTDYRTATASAGFTRALGERGSVGLSVAYLNFDTSPFVSQSESWSGNATYTYAFSPTIKGSATVGVQSVVTSQAQAILLCPVDPVLCQQGLVPLVPVGTIGESTQLLVPFNVNGQWQISERNSLAATVLQRVNPSGVGALTSGIQVSASFIRTLSPVSELSVNGNYIRSRALAGATIGDVITISPTVSWRLSEAWTTSASYVRTRVTYPTLDRDQDVDSNALFVSVTYGWPQWSKAY